MRVGVEGNHVPDAAKSGGIPTLSFAKMHSLDGVFFRSLLDLSKTLDQGELREAKAYADELGLYIQVGIGRVNPYNTQESPEVYLLGKGSYTLGIERLIRAARTIDCTELWAETATYKHHLPRYYKSDRFRSEAPWADQLKATQKFLQSLAPLLRDTGCRVNLETHEEITSFEIVRIVETVGPDVVGVCFDTANIVARGEHPVHTARRVAPYVHQTHFKDIGLYFQEDGLAAAVLPCGQGVLDWNAILSLLGKHAPNLNVSIEDHKVVFRAQCFDAHWRALHPDFTAEEFADLIQLAKTCEAKIARGELDALEMYNAMDWQDHKIERLHAARDYLKQLIHAKGLAN